MHACDFQVREAGQDYWVDVVGGGIFAAGASAERLDRGAVGLDSRYRGDNVATTTVIPLSPELCATRWAECRFGLVPLVKCLISC